MSVAKDCAVDLIRTYGACKRPEPVRLGTGELTWIYLDVKGILVDGNRLHIAARALEEHIEKHLGAPTIKAIGGPTMGADVLSHAVAMRDTGLRHSWKWLSVRDTRKTTHGLGRWIEGYQPHEGDRVVLTDDVANSGKSLVDAWDRITDTGAKIVAIMPLVDRSGRAEERLRAAGIMAPYIPVMDYNDLGLLPLQA